VLEAGEAGIDLARESAAEAGERMNRATSTARRRFEETTERVGETATDAARSAAGVGVQLLHLPALVRQGARRTVERAEEAGARAVVSAIKVGTRALNRAADYVSELAPRRRVQRKPLADVLVEELRWAHEAVEAYDRTAELTESAELRMRIVRVKLQAIKHGETLSQLVRAVGASVPTEERMPPPPIVPGRDVHEARSPAALRESLAHALTIAVQIAEGWRALGRISTWAEQDQIADAIMRARTSVGEEPEEHVEFVRDALLEATVETVLA